MSQFRGKNILITGGASGIGLLMGQKALRKDAQQLIVWDINTSTSSKLSVNQQDFADKIFIQQVDISDPDQIYSAAQDVLANFHHIDILINNAGIVTGKLFHKHTRKEIQHAVDVNQVGAMHTTRAFLPHMIDRRNGHIVNIASAAGLVANPKMSVYASSKWGLIGWSESLRIELEQENTGIKVTTIEPSYIKTGMFEGVTAPLLTPLLEPDYITDQIISAIEKDKIHLREPFMVKLIPFLKGVLPAKLFDLIAGKLFGVYRSMDTFKGHSS